ncbi:MAG: helix-turn-helix transcriptional regulator [Oscillospiraceae bacterium]|nr:helix-turn-helix transcriptional regulator [Oscillospiraceae bacterium]
MYTSLSVCAPVRIAEVYSFFRHHFRAGYHFCGEMHDFWEVVYVEAGKLRVTAEAQIYELSAGELIIHPPMEFHNLFTDDPDGADVVIFSFGAQLAEEELFSQKVFALKDLQKTMICRIFSYLDDRKDQNEAHLKWRRTVDEASDARWFLDYMRLFEHDGQALSMAASFAEQLLISLNGSEGRTRENLTGDAKLFRAAVDHVRTYLDQSISVEDLAAAIGISRSGLNRLFQKYAGVSVHRYCLMQKIKTATRYLQSGLSVTETSERLSFSNQSYFSACYKRETGNNPSEIKKAPSDEGAGKNL